MTLFLPRLIMKSNKNNSECAARNEYEKNLIICNKEEKQNIQLIINNLVIFYNFLVSILKLSLKCFINVLFAFQIIFHKMI